MYVWEDTTSVFFFFLFQKHFHIFKYFQLLIVFGDGKYLELLRFFHFEMCLWRVLCIPAHQRNFSTMYIVYEPLKIQHLLDWGCVYISLFFQSPLNCYSSKWFAVLSDLGGGLFQRRNLGLLFYKKRSKIFNALQPDSEL